MLTVAERQKRYRATEEVYRLRSKNLRALIARCRDWQHASRITGKSVQLLKQAAGESSYHVSIGDKLAAELEYAFRLNPGALSVKWSL